MPNMAEPWLSFEVLLSRSTTEHALFSWGDAGSLSLVESSLLVVPSDISELFCRFSSILSSLLVSITSSNNSNVTFKSFITASNCLVAIF